MRPRFAARRRAFLFPVGDIRARRASRRLCRPRPSSARAAHPPSRASCSTRRDERASAFAREYPDASRLRDSSLRWSRRVYPSHSIRELTGIPRHTVPVVVGLHSVTSSDSHLLAALRIRQQRPNCIRSPLGVGGCHSNSGLPVANGRADSPRVSPNRGNARRSGLQKRNAKSLDVDLVVHARGAEVYRRGGVSFWQLVVAHRADESNSIRDAELLRERSQAPFVDAFADNDVAQLGKIAAQRRHRANSHVLALVRYEPRDGQNDRSIFHSPAPAQRSSVARWIESYRIRPKTKLGHRRGFLDSNLFHHT